MTSLYGHINIPSIIPQVNYNWGKRDVFIFDLDSCISDDEWRLVHIKDAKDGDTHDKFVKYHQLLGNDHPIANNASILKEILDTERVVVFATARPEAFREPTSNWLNYHFNTAKCKAYVHLLMRDNDDLRGSVEIKREMLRKIRGVSTTIKGAYDDRNDIVQMYVEEGVNAWVMDKYHIRRAEIGRVNPPESYYPADSMPTPQEPNMEKILKAAQGIPTIAISSRLGEVERTVTASGATFAQVEAAAQRVDAAISEFGDKESVLADEGEEPSHSARQSLQAAIDTYDERRGRYGAVEGTSAAILELLFPEGVKLKTFADFSKFQMIVHVVGKLGRYAGTGMTHRDSVHDLITYAALLDSATVNAERDAP